MLCGPYLQIILKYANLSFLQFTFRLDICIDKLFNGNRSYELTSMLLVFLWTLFFDVLPVYRFVKSDIL